MRQPTRLVTLAAWCVAVAALVGVLSADAAATAPTKRVRLIQVLHRHGARSSTPSYNESLLCTESPCGYLSPAGITMLQNVGGFLRARYNTDNTVVETPMFPSRDYDIKVVYSRSTDVLRTLQSAEAFLSGFFPNPKALFPAVHTQPKAYDWLLRTSHVMPYLHYYYVHNKPYMYSINNVPTDELFPDWTELTRIGATVSSEGYCDVYFSRSDCARQLYDIAAAKRAGGELHNYSLLEKYYEKLQRVSRAAFDFEFHYNKTNPLHAKQGGRGRVFVEQMLSNMDDTIEGRSTYPLMHYSAHESTLAPVWGTLGDRSDNGMLPPFAQTLVAELLVEDGSGAYHVRVLRGHPGQDPASGFEFAWDPTWQLRCVDAGGALYAASENTCPLADFRRLVEWSAPTAESGLCYLDDTFVKVRNCPEDGGADGGAVLSDTCKYYRERCARFSCGTGCVLNGVSLECVCGEDSSDKKKENKIGGGAAAGIAVVTFFLGCIIAVAFTVLIYLWRGASSRYVVVEGAV